VKHVLISERTVRSIKNFCAALGHCVFEDGDALTLAVPVFVCIGLLMLFVSALGARYELIFDPNSADVSASLARLSIDLTKWVGSF
jgi:hypothetical protein